MYIYMDIYSCVKMCILCKRLYMLIHKYTRHIYIHHMYIYIYITYTYICIYICVCVYYTWLGPIHFCVKICIV